MTSMESAPIVQLITIERESVSISASEKDMLASLHFRRNFTCHFTDGIFAVAGFSALGIATILPGMVHQMALRDPSLVPFENRLATMFGTVFWGDGSLTNLVTLQFL